MKFVDPSKGGTTLRQTLTQRVVLLRPTSTDLIEAGCAAALCLIALLGFASTFDSWRFMIVSAIGVVLGLVLSHLVTVSKWHGAVMLVLGAVAYFLLGGAVALRGNLIIGVVPSIQTETDLASLAVRGWKGLLTTLPPVAGGGVFLVLPYLLALFASMSAYSIARTNPLTRAMLAPPIALFALVILLGNITPTTVLPQGLGFAAVSAAWLVTRSNRHRQLSGLGNTRRSRVVASVLLVAVAAAGGALLGPRLPFTTDVGRVVLRTYLLPPIDVSQLPSPLAGFRKFSSETVNPSLVDEVLLTVSGVSEGDLVRFAVLDSYSGLAWSATGQDGSGGGFRRVGSSIPVSQSGTLETIRVTIADPYARANELNVWGPAIGQSATVSFVGTTADAHAESLAYDLAKGQILVADRLKSGDIVSTTSMRVPVADGSAQTPSGTPLVSGTRTQFLSEWLASILANSSGSAWDQLMTVASKLQNGAWSDGTKPGEARYLPGHGEARLASMIAGPELVGSDEHYAALFGLVANRLGFPARVIYGGIVEADGSIRGADVTAWVEVRTTNGWIAIPTGRFTPDRSRMPDNTPPSTDVEEAIEPVPPPNPAEAPGNMDDELGSQNNATKAQPPEDGAGWVIPTPVIYTAVGVGSLLFIIMALLGAKLIRHKRRYSRSDLIARVHGGWLEILDRARDKGAIPIPGATHHEQASAVGMPQVQSIAAATDWMMFGPNAPTDETVAAYLAEVDEEMRNLLATEKPLRRFWIRVNPRSLVPFSDTAIKSVEAVTSVVKASGKRVADITDKVRRVKNHPVVVAESQYGQ